MTYTKILFSISIICTAILCGIFPASWVYDSVNYQAFASSPLPKLLSGFDGHHFGSGDTSPVDVSSAAGPNHIVEIVNLHFDIFTKQGTLVSSTELAPFFAGSDSAPSASNYMYDPKVLFDSNSGRWFATVADSTSKSVRLVVSATDNPNGNWFRYNFSVGNECPDQPSIAASADKFLISLYEQESLEEINCSGGSTHGTQFFIFSKSDLTSGLQSPTYQSIFKQFLFYAMATKLNSPTSTLYAANLFGNNLRIFTISGTVPNAAVTNTNMTLNQLNSPAPYALEPGNAQLFAGGYNQIQDAAWNNGKLWVTTVEDCLLFDGTTYSHHSCIRLAQIDTSSFSITQDFTYKPPDNKSYFFYPSLATDTSGNMILVYGYSSLNTYPSLAVTAQQSTDSPGILQPAQTIKQGNSPTIETLYGDYFSATQDPSNSSVVWVSGEYITSAFGSSSRWATYIASVSLGGSSTLTTSKLTVDTADISCNVINGFYTVLFQNGNVISRGFSPATFTLNNNQQYVAEVQNYGSFAFDHWKDTGSKVSDRPISISTDTQITAIYKNLDNPSATGSCSGGAASPDFTISVNPATLNIQQGSSGSSTITIRSINGFNSAVALSVAASISGVTATLNPTSVTPSSGGSATSTLTISASSTAAPGSYQLTVTGMIGSLSHSTTVNLAVSAPSTSSKLTVSTADVVCNSITGYYTLLSENGAVVNTGFSPVTFTLKSGQKYAVEVQDYDSYAFDHWKDTQSTVRDRQISISTDTSVTAIYKNLDDPSATGSCSIVNKADFSVSANPTSVNVQTGSSGSSTLTVASLDGFSSSVSLTITSSPLTGATATLSRVSVTPPSNGQSQSVLTISASSSAAPGTYQLTVKGTSGSLSHSVTISVTISQPSSQTIISVKTVDSGGSEIFGYYTTLWQTGALIKSGFSPVSFTATVGQTYQVAVADYGRYVFDHWSDGSKDRFHNAQGGSGLTAVYRVA